jgi:hypothetical protein
MCKQHSVSVTLAVNYILELSGLSDDGWRCCTDAARPAWEARDPSMMTNERKIWQAALMLVRKHGAAAPEIAEREALRLRGGGDELTCVVWCWIARTTAELLRPVPQENERIH